MQPPDTPEPKLATPEAETELVADNTLPSRGPAVSRGVDATTQRFADECERRDDTASRMVGRVLNEHFELLSLVAEGGMSYVYRARDIALKKIVAVKMLRPHLLQQPNSMRRLQQEALATSTLDHPNTVAVRHFDMTPEGEPYLVMDYLEGRSLAQVLAEEGRIETGRAVGMLVQMAEALVSAHAKGIVHRDLKPSNVLLVTYAGSADFVKIVDFGIAKVVTPEEAEVTSNLTVTGEIFGSPLAMSPEQCRGEKVDYRSDIYSFGCLMYQMLTGRPVFREKTTVEVLFRQLHEMPDSFKTACPEAKIPPHLEAIAFKALQKNPKHRYQSMQELLDNLRGLDKTSVIDSALVRLGLAAQNKKRIRTLVIGALVAGLAMGGAGIGVFTAQLAGNEDSLLNRVVDWERPPLSPAPVARTQQPLAVRQSAIQKADLYIKQTLESKRGNHASLELTKAEALSAVSRLKDEAQRCFAAGAYNELNVIAKYAQLAATAFRDKSDASDPNLDGVRSIAMGLKTIGDLQFKARSVDPAVHTYEGALRTAQKISALSDSAYFRKLIGDGYYAMAESAENRDTDNYANAITEYTYFINAPMNDLKLVSPTEYRYANGRELQLNPNDLEYSPLAWDAHRKLADSHYLTEPKSRDYARAADLYKWCVDHGPSPLRKELGEETTFQWRKADSERMSGHANWIKIPADQKGNAAKLAHLIFDDYKAGLINDPFHNAKNVALCHAYMAALAERFNIPREHWDGTVYTSMADALKDVRNLFGADEATTLFVEREYADDLWQKQNYFESIKHSMHAAFAAVKAWLTGIAHNQ